MNTRWSWSALGYLKDTSSVFRGNGLPDESRWKEPRKGRGKHKAVDHDDAMVCLTCKRTTCAGEAACFRERKKRMENGGP